ncbi:hypothetical protein Tsp_09763 [Trichinella spiralis]|uniref:hypothetical protein n=1 Tax=Trichinella spiralis TaxID=6334 RepID=UPI0001EFD736|nr:hypothetical protein Tsp_09763 [Trichinella spiralis]
MGGMVLETNMNEILTRVNEQDKIEKQEVKLIRSLILVPFHYAKGGIVTAPARAVTAMKNMNLSQQIKDIRLPDLPSTCVTQNELHATTIDPSHAPNTELNKQTFHIVWYGIGATINENII